MEINVKMIVVLDVQENFKEQIIQYVKLMGDAKVV